MDSDIETSLEDAERACANYIAKTITLPVQIAINQGYSPDTAVFDIGNVQTGDTQTFKSRTFHWRAQLDMYSRDRAVLQRNIMRILAAMPIGRAYPLDAVQGDSNVVDFRVAPETNAISGIVTSKIETPNGKSMVDIPVWTATVMFDVTFTARRDA